MVVDLLLAWFILLYKSVGHKYQSCLLGGMKHPLLSYS